MIPVRRKSSLHTTITTAADIAVRVKHVPSICAMPFTEVACILAPCSAPRINAKGGGNDLQCNNGAMAVLESSFESNLDDLALIFDPASEQR